MPLFCKNLVDYVNRMLIMQIIWKRYPISKIPSVSFSKKFVVDLLFVFLIYLFLLTFGKLFLSKNSLPAS